VKKLPLSAALKLLDRAEIITCPELGSHNCSYELAPGFENFLELEDDDTDVRGAYCFRFFKEDNQTVYVEGDLMTLVAAATGNSETRYLRLKLMVPLNLEEA